jgi:hypothetical protein
MHRRKDKSPRARRAGGYWNVTGNDSVLLSVFFSPGTFEIVAVSV